MAVTQQNLACVPAYNMFAYEIDAKTAYSLYSLCELAVEMMFGPMYAVIIIKLY